MVRGMAYVTLMTLLGRTGRLRERTGATSTRWLWDDAICGRYDALRRMKEVGVDGRNPLGGDHLER
jgi:hypothetical protein